MSAPENDRRPWDGSEIAVIGMTCRFPDARDVESLWRNLCNGHEAISFFDQDELERSMLDSGIEQHPDYVKAAPLLEGADGFDAAFFDYSPKEAEVMDPQQRLFLECAWEALEAAGYDPETYGGLVGVFAGASTDTYVFNLFTNRTAVGGGFDAFQVGLGNDLAFLANRVSYKLNLRGPSFALHTACSTSLVAVHLARQSLLLDECQLAIAGAASMRVPQKTGYLYRQGGVLSPDGHCRPFDAEARGTLFGSGVGVVVLKRLEDALADGDQIHAVLLGSAINNDGAMKASFSAPSVHGQTEVLLDAIADADIDPRSVGYVEAHGTGTNLGDPIEMRALVRAFRRFTDDTNFCAIGSVKSNMGHLDATAGMPGLLKTILALKEGRLPPSLHFNTPNPQIDFEKSPFYVQTTLGDWPANGGPRRAGVSSFGVGGTNAHLILEQPPDPVPPAPWRPWQILPLSAKTATALDTIAENLHRHLKARPELPLGDVAYTLQVGRRSFPYRRVLVVRDGEDAIAQLANPDPQWVAGGLTELGERPVAFLFPGGGAQYVGMGRGLYETEEVFRQTFDRCRELLQPQLDLDIRDVVYPAAQEREAAAERLRQTWLALPALFTVEYSLARLWMAKGIEPGCLIGHSLGEYVAACLAGVFSLEDALTLVVTRGRLLRTLRVGAMLSVAWPAAEVEPLLGDGCSLAADNAPQQCVVSGSPEAVDEVQAALEARGAETRRLHIDAPGHSPLVEPILAEFEEVARGMELAAPEIPCISNVSGDWLRDDQARDPAYWSAHLRRTVRFADGVRKVLEDPTRVLLEVAPGRTLTVLSRMHGTPERPVSAIASMRHPKDPRDDRAMFLTAAGQLWLAGVEIPWARFHGEGRQRVALPTYPFERQPFWIEPGSLGAGGDASLVPSGKASNLADWFYQPVFTPSLSPPPADLWAGETPEDENWAPRRWLVFLDGAAAGPGRALVQGLRDSGRTVVSVRFGDGFTREGADAFTLQPGNTDDYRALLDTLAGEDHLPEGILHLGDLGCAGAVPEHPPADGGAAVDAREGIARFRRLQETGYFSLFFLGKALAAHGAGGRLVVIDDQLFDVSGQEATLPEKAPLAGLLKVLCQEQQDLDGRVVDSPLPEPGDEAAWVQRMLSECLSPSDRREVAWRGDRRWVRDYQPLALGGDAPHRRPLRAGGTYLVTGGLGGVGRLLAGYLAREYQARLVLAGRSPFPARERWPELAAGPEGQRESDIAREFLEWEAAGAEILVVQADVADRDAMAAALAAADERFGPLHGVLHTAGVTTGPSLYRPIAELGREESEVQFGPKAYGVYVLEELLAGRQLDFCLLFSSNASVLGGLGYSIYAAVNLFMDHFANARKRCDGVPWVSASWDAWPQETRKYQDVQTSMDQYTMTPDEGAEAFRRVACLGPEGAVAVPVGDLEARLAIWVHAGDRNARGGTTVHARPDDVGTYVAPRDETEERVAEIWQEVLGIERIGVTDNFFDLGGHSLLATRMVSRLNDTFALEFPLGRFFEAPTVEGCAQLLAELRGQEEDEEKAEILSLLATLTEDEAAEQLAALHEGDG